MPLCRARSSSSRFSVIHSLFSRALASIKGNAGGVGADAPAAAAGGHRLGGIEVASSRHQGVDDGAAELSF